MYADLHVHSFHSDGSLSPRQIAEQAAANRVRLLAVADHDLAQGSIEIAPLLAELGIGYLPAAEHTCLLDKNTYHVLGYGEDLRDPALIQLMRRARSALDLMSDELIARMAASDARVSPSDYQAFEHDRTIGGWKGIEYLMRRGVTQTLHQGMALYAEHGVRYEHADFPALEETIRRIHGAGGRAVLAHPGVSVRLEQPEFERKLESLLDMGLDGMECHYPRHAPWQTRTCLQLCEGRRLMVTAGSDCHGSFGDARVGEMDVQVSKLQLNGLMVR